MKKIFLFLLCLLWVEDAFALAVRQKMDVKIGVFDAASIVLNYSYTGNEFDISAEVKTAHLFDTLYPFSAIYHSYGSFIANRTIPKIYQARSQSRNHIRTKKIFYDEKGFAYKKISTKDEVISEKRIVGISKDADASDLQSVFAELIRKVMKTGDCNLRREIDDGKKHYRFISSDKGVQKRYFVFLKKDEEARLCSVYVENLKDNNDNILWDVSADRPIKLWIKRDEQTKLPFVLEIGIDSTPLGALKVTPTDMIIK